MLKLSKILLEDESQVDYAYGYFIAMASLGLFFDYDVVEKEYVYEITYVKADLLENVKNKLQARLTDEKIDISIDLFIEKIQQI